MSIYSLPSKADNVQNVVDEMTRDVPADAFNKLQYCTWSDVFTASFI